MKLNLKEQVLPHLLVVLVFAALVCAYFAPVIFKGKQLKQSDTVQWAGAANEISQHREKYGEEPLWTNSQFGGMPAYVISVLYPGEWLETLDKAMSAGFPHPVAVIFVGLVCYYILLLAYGLTPWMALLGSLAFTFFSFNFVSMEAGHNSKLRAMTFTPMLLAGIVLVFRQKWVLGAALAALGAGLQLRSGHTQISYYFVFIALILGANELFWAIKDGKLKQFFIAVAVLIVAGGIGVGTSAARLMSLNEYMAFSMRGKPELTIKDDNKPKDGGLDRDYVFSWSHGTMENFTLLIPGLYGGSTQEPVSKKSPAVKAATELGFDANQITTLPLYWGDQPFTSGPVYAGAIIIFLFVLGLLVVNPRQRWWLLAATVLSIALATGKHFPAFNYLMYDYFPSYNKFRTVTMALFIAQLTLPLMAVLAVKDLLELRKTNTHEALQKLYIAAGVTAGICAIFFLMPSIAGDFTSANDEQVKGMFGNDQRVSQIMMDGIYDTRESLARADAMRSLLFILAGAALLWLAVKDKLNATLASVALAVLVLVDLWAVDKRYLNDDSFSKTYYSQALEKSAADDRILQDKAQYRVLNLQGTFSETRTSYFHHSLGGYSPVKLRRYQDLIERDLTAEIQRLPKVLQQPGELYDLMQDVRFINMLNTKYIKYGDKAEEVILNPAAKGNAWFVSRLVPTNTPDLELDSTLTIDYHNAAVINTTTTKPSAMSYEVQGASIEVKEYRANRIEYTAETPAKAFAVFSEVYYPAGWTATIDGQPVDIMRANYLFRALEIPAGKHSIVFEFKPETYFLGNNISRVCSLLVIAGLVFAGFSGWKQLQAGKE